MNVDEIGTRIRTPIVLIHIFLQANTVLFTRLIKHLHVPFRKSKMKKTALSGGLL